MALWCGWHVAAAERRCLRRGRRRWRRSVRWRWLWWGLRQRRRRNCLPQCWPGVSRHLQPQAPALHLALGQRRRINAHPLKSTLHQLRSALDLLYRYMLYNKSTTNRSSGVWAQDLTDLLISSPILVLCSIWYCLLAPQNYGCNKR